jgi:HK97 family phage portal protein
VRGLKFRVPFTNRSIEFRSITSTLSNPVKWLVDMFGGGAATYTGKYVTEFSAMQTITVFACVRVLSESIASVPLVIYKRKSDGSRERATSHPLYTLLHDLPNPRMTSFTMRETMMAHLVTWGNAYGQIIRNKSSGAIEAIYPLRPDRMFPYINEITDEIVYLYTKNGKEITLYPEDVLHIPGLGFDGIKGYSVIAMARQSIGLAQATEEYGARYFGNGARPGGVFKTSQKLSQPAYDRLKAQVKEDHGGLENSHKFKILEEGMEYQQIGLPPEDSQFLETRKYQRSEIAGLFNVPPHMIGDLENATFSNIENQSLSFVVNTMRSWYVRWEQALNWKTLNNDKRYYCEFLMDALLRGDSAARAAFYKSMFGIGVYSQNDIRVKENDNPIPGGNVYFVPLNMRPHDVPYTAPKGGEPDNANKGNQGDPDGPPAGE